MNRHFDFYYSYGTINPESDQVNQWWFDKGKVSFITPDWRLTLDKQEKRIISAIFLIIYFTTIPGPFNSLNNYFLFQTGNNQYFNWKKKVSLTIISVFLTIFLTIPLGLYGGWTVSHRTKNPDAP